MKETMRRDGNNRGSRSNGGGRGGGRLQQLPREPVQHKIMPPKEASPIETVPLLIYPVSVTEFIIFEDALLAHVATKFPLDGKCLRLGEYQAELMPTAEDVEASMIVYSALGLPQRELDAQRREMLTSLGRQYLKDRSARLEEKRLLHGCVLSVMSRRSRQVVENSDGAAINTTDDPLALWKTILRTHKTGTHHLNAEDALIKLQSDYVNCKQRSWEILADFETRFNRTADNYEAALGQIIDDAARSRQFIHGISRERNAEFHAEITRMKNVIHINPFVNAGLPVTVAAALEMAELYRPATRTSRADAPLGIAYGAEVGDDDYDSEGDGRLTSSIVYGTDIGESKGNVVPSSRIFRCYYCNEEGHAKRHCPKLLAKRAAVEGAPKDAAASTVLSTVSGVEPIVDERVVINAAGAGGRLELYYDSCATHHVITDKELLTGLREADRRYFIEGITGDRKYSNLIGEIHPFGWAIYLPEAGRNIISPGRMITEGNECTVNYVHDVDGGYVVTSPQDERFEFNLNPDGLFVCAISGVDVSFSRAVSVTEEERKRQFDRGAIARADEVRRAEQVTGFASPGDIAFAVNNGAILNAPFTARDVAVAEYIYGQSRGSILGKSTKAKPVQDSAELDGRVETQKEQQLHIDVFKTEDSWFLLSVVHPMGQFLVGEVSARRKKDTVLKTVLMHIGVCNQHGFRISRVVCDQEPALIAMIGKLGDTIVLPVAQGQHVKRAERAIRTVKDRARAVLHSLPFKLPWRCVPYLMSWVVQRFNAMPRRSLGLVPANELFTGKKFDYSTDGAFAFGDFVVAPEAQTDNTMAPRARFCLVMCQKANLSRNWILFDIERGTFVTRASFRLQPLLNEHVARINEFAARDSHVRDITVTDELPFEEGHVAENTDVVGMNEEAFPILPIEMNLGQAPVGNEPEVLVQEDDDIIVGGSADIDPAPVIDAQENQIEVEEPMQGTMPELRRSARLAGRRVEVYDLRVGLEAQKSPQKRHLGRKAVVSHMFVAEATRKYGKIAMESAEAELKEILERSVLRGITPAEAMSKRKRKKIIKTFLFFKEKFGKTGELERLKARLVASDNSFESSLHPDKDSPTVRLESLLMVLAISGAEGRRVMAMDVGNAYLEADMTGDDEVLIELDAWVVHVLKKLAPHIESFVDEKGRMVARLCKALYGCVQSAKLWYRRLRDVLEAAGFVANRFDECVFNAIFEGKQITVCVYVDDLLCTCVDPGGLKWLEQYLRSAFRKLTVKDGDQIEFVSLEIDQRYGEISISMEKYIRSLLEEWGGSGSNATPADTDLFKSDVVSAQLDNARRVKFHRLAARLIYLTKRIAPDMLLAVNVLSGKVKSPSIQDWDRLDRVFRYLNGSSNRIIKFRRGGKISVCCYIDASFACHEDMRSRTGCILFCCGNFVGAWTSKQSQNTKSSTESELVGVTDECGWVIWAQNWMAAQGYQREAPVIYQDNTSVADILKRGPCAQLRTRHLSIRHHFAGDLMKKKELVIEYCPTEDMIADILTKPLIGENFRRLRDRMVKVN